MKSCVDGLKNSLFLFEKYLFLNSLYNMEIATDA